MRKEWTREKCIQALNEYIVKNHRLPPSNATVPGVPSSPIFISRVGQTYQQYAKENFPDVPITGGRKSCEWTRESIRAATDAFYEKYQRRPKMLEHFINLTFCCQQATVITDFSDLDAIGRQHYMTMQGGACRIEELERLDGRKFALDLILNHTEGRITPYGVVYDNGMKLEQLYDGRHFPCYHYQPNLLAVGLSSRQEPENTDQITWLLLPCSEQQLRRGIARSGVDIHNACIWYEDSMLPPEVEEVLEGQQEDLFALNDMAAAIAALSDLEQKKLAAVMEMAKPECAGEIRKLAENLELFEFAPKVRTPAEYGRYMIQDSGHYEYDPNLDEFYDYARYGKLRMEQEAGAFTERGYIAYRGTLPLKELMASDPAEQHQREQEFQMGGM